IVAARAFEGGVDESLRRLRSCGSTNDFVELTVPQAFDQTIRAEQKAVTGGTRYGSGLRFDELMARAERLMQNVAHRMGARFPFSNSAIAAQPSNVTVIVGKLRQTAASRQMVNAAVSDVPEVKPARREPDHAKGCAHA